MCKEIKEFSVVNSVVMNDLGVIEIAPIFFAPVVRIIPYRGRTTKSTFEV